MWLIENCFIFSKNTSNSQVVNVLSRVPSYKINLTSPVSADRFRGNIHHRLSIINWRRLLNQTSPSNLVKLNAFKSIEFFKKNTRIVNYSVLKNKEKKNSPTNDNLKFSYTQNKTLRFFLNTTLKRKFYKDFHIITVKKIIKNKRKRKAYAIKRTSKLDAVNSARNFYKVFLKKQLFGKRLSPMRTSLKKRKLQRYKYVLGLRFFRKNFIYQKKISKKNVRFVKNMLYFSHVKLHNECRMLNEFKKTNFKRKRFLSETMSTINNVGGTLQPHTFLTQKTKTRLTSPNSPNITTTNELKPYSFTSLLCKHNTIYNNPQLLITSISNLTLLKSSILNESSPLNVFDTKSTQFAFSTSITNILRGTGNVNPYNNLIPVVSLNKTVAKTVTNSFKNSFFQENVISWYHNTMIRFIEDCTGKKTLFQFYPFMNQDVSPDFVVRYKR